MASIVVVEDEMILGRQLRNALTSAGHDITLATSGQEALQALTTAEPDLALIDLRLPDQSGLDLLNTMRAQAPGLPPHVYHVDGWGTGVRRRVQRPPV